MRKVLFTLFVSLLFLNNPGCFQKSQERQLHVFAGSIAKPFLDSASEKFEEKYRVQVIIEYGGSGSVLSRAIISQRGDIYISGSPDFMEKALSEGAVMESSVFSLACLQPAVVTLKKNEEKITDVRSLIEENIAFGIADPGTVCLGRVAEKAFLQAGIEDGIKKAKLHAHSCMSLLNLLLEGKIEAAIGWKEFESLSGGTLKAHPIKNLPPTPILAGLMTYTGQKELAQKFLNFLRAPEVQKIIIQKGYTRCRD